MEGFVIYCTKRDKFYQGSQSYGAKPKFYKQRNHASCAISNVYGPNDTLHICNARLVIDLPEIKEI